MSLTERTGEAFEFDERLTVVGNKLEAGDPAPEFTLDRLDSDGAIRQARLADTAGRVRLLNIVNSLDTPVCEAETRSWERLRHELPEEVVTLTVSMDLPFAQARWAMAEQVGHGILSAHKSAQFGKDYGVLLKEWRMLQRAVFVIDGDGQIVHSEYVADQMTEPDYDAAVAAARGAASE